MHVLCDFGEEVYYVILRSSLGEVSSWSLYQASAAKAIAINFACRLTCGMCRNIKGLDGMMRN